MRLLSRYLLADFGVSSLAVLLALLVTWLAGDSLRHLDDLGRSWTFGAQRILLSSLEVVSYSVPIACLVGAAWTLTRAARGQELVAIRAGGIPLRRALAPLVLGSLAVAVALGVFQDRISIPAQIALERAVEQQDEEATRRPRKLADRFWHARAGSVFSAGAYDRESRTLSDVTMFRIDPSGEIRERVDAETATNLELDVWEFHALRSREFRDVGGIGQRLSSDLRVDLGLTGTDLERLERLNRLQSLRNLYRGMRDPSASVHERSNFALLFHARVIEPLVVVVLVLFAIPLAIGHSERGGSLARVLLLSLAWAAGYWVAWALAFQASQRHLVQPPVALWGVAGAALGLGLLRCWRVRE
ncbi:MAG: LptF/LptG family permease [Proteobacteria bacterium]|nr:LptF/LptG family permease [Pseudomonadota bacterium]